MSAHLIVGLSSFAFRVFRPRRIRLGWTLFVLFCAATAAAQTRVIGGTASFTDLTVTNLTVEVSNNVRKCDAFAGADAGAKIAACIADLPATGGVADAQGLEGAQDIAAQIVIDKPNTCLLFGSATFTASIATTIFSTTDQNSVCIIGTGVDATTFIQNGAGGGITLAGTAEINNIHLQGFTLTGPGGATSTAVGITGTNVKDSEFIDINVNNWRGDGVDFSGAGTLNNLFSQGRYGGATDAVSTSRAIDINACNNCRIEYIYFNGGGNPATTGSSYDTAVDLTGTTGPTVMLGNIYDGFQFAVRTNHITASVGERFDFSSAPPVALSNGYFPSANNLLTIIGANGTLPQLINNPGGAVDQDFIYIPVLNDGIGPQRAFTTGFAVGALTTTWTIARSTPDTDITVTRLQTTAKTAPVGCSTNAVVRITNGTTFQDLTVTGTVNDSGALSLSYLAAQTLDLVVQTAAVGCGTAPADVQVVAQYRKTSSP